MVVKKHEHYVSNKEFYEEMVLFLKARKVEPDLKIPDCIGSKILKICQKLAFRPNFINYTYRDEMVGDAIENCITYIGNFNPEKSKNPFSYFTQIAYFAYLRRIAKEKKVTKLKAKYVQNLSTMSEVFTNALMDSQGHDDISQQFAEMSELIQGYYNIDLSGEKPPKKPGRKKKQPSKPMDLGKDFGDDSSS